MKNFCKTIFVPIVFLFGASSASSSDIELPEKITFVADEWCPFNCEPNSDKEGYVMEIIRSSFGQNHIIEYKLASWTDALKQVEVGSADCVIGASTTESPNSIYMEKTIGRTIVAMWVRKDNPWRYEGPSSISNISIATQEGWEYISHEFNQAIKKHKKLTYLSGERAIEDGIALLDSGKVDMYIESSSVFEYKTNTKGIRGKFAEAGYTSSPVDLYIACSPVKTSTNVIVGILDRNLTIIRKNGKLATILKKYGIKDWEKEVVHRR